MKKKVEKTQSEGESSGHLKGIKEPAWDVCVSSSVGRWGQMNVSLPMHEYALTYVEGRCIHEA